MVTAPVIQATRASQSKAQTPVLTLTTPKVSQNILMLLRRSILQIRIVLVMAGLQNW
jgi:hypothetical protein